MRFGLSPDAGFSSVLRSAFDPLRKRWLVRRTTYRVASNCFALVLRVFPMFGAPGSFPEFERTAARIKEVIGRDSHSTNKLGLSAPGAAGSSCALSANSLLANWGTALL